MSNTKVFVSPGVYTSEVDLSFVSQSVGVTTLGIVGETLKGPAFEPIFIRNFDEFTAFFGGTSPEKFINTQIPKYEAAYIAKAYLQQSNQLFVTRILGLSGYDAGPSWSISTIANVDQSTVDFLCLGSTIPSGTCEPVCTGFSVYNYSFEFTGCTNSVDSITFNTPVNPLIQSKLDLPFEQFNGSVSTLRTNVLQQIFDVMVDDTTEANSIYYYGPISGSDYSTLVTAGYTAETNVFQIDNVDASLIDYNAPINDPWYYALFDHTGINSMYTGFSYYSIVSGLTLLPTTVTTTMPPIITTTTTNPCVTPSPTTTTTTAAPIVVNCYSGIVTGTIYVFSGMAYTNYDDLVLATLRSRGIATYGVGSTGPAYQVTGLTDVSLDCSGTYSGVSKNPYATFGVNVTDKDGDSFFFETSFSNSNVNYIGKVFGYSNFAKPRTVVPLFLEERFQSLLNYAYRKGYIRGLNCNLTSLDTARSSESTSIAWYLEQYQSPQSPWIVSELRGNKVFNLFKFITIADGNTANTELKISIANISFNNGTFDVLVRDFFDTDANPVVIEKFTNCTMNPNENSFIAKKIGTSNGEFQMNSKYIMLEMNEDAPVDALPCGFEGYMFREYAGVKSPFPIFKTKYDFPGEIIFNPPFGLTSGADDISRSAGDNVRRTYLGMSDTIGYDIDFFGYKGKQNPTDPCDGVGTNWSFKSQGFHMDKNASGITISNFFATSGTSAFQVGSAEFISDPDDNTNPYFRLFARKFTLFCQGGFDGWDIYRERRSNGDEFRLGGQGFLRGVCASLRYPTATGLGTFKRITVGGDREEFASTDYYAYLLGQKTFSNPESVNINIFVTPGIDYVNNSNLVETAIEMVEFDRADSIYICTTPDYNLLVPTTTDPIDSIFPQEAVDGLEESNIDSNYTATYYPWV